MTEQDFQEPTPREALIEVAETCKHALAQRVAKRFSTRESLKALERRARSHIDAPEDREWLAEATRIVTTASALLQKLTSEYHEHGHA